jgi:hypothetical protein
MAASPVLSSPAVLTQEVTMSSEKKNVRLQLTPEQKDMIKNATGKTADAVEFTVQELEERIAPFKAL